MFEGLPSVATYFVDLVKRREQRRPLALVLHYLLGDLINAVDHALHHYFPFDLDAPFLQNSRLGPPFSKWSYFTNKDFAGADESLRLLLVAAWHWYEDVDVMWHHGGSPALKDAIFFSSKDAWVWFDSVRTNYASCLIDDELPRMTISSINIAGWIDDEHLTFRNLVNCPPPWQEIQVPPIVTKTELEIGDRSIIADFQRQGLARLKELQRIHAEFGKWLRSNYTLEQMTASHRSTLDSAWLG